MNVFAARSPTALLSVTRSDKFRPRRAHRHSAALAQGDSRNEVILPGYTASPSLRQSDVRPQVQLVDLKPNSLDYDQVDLERKVSPEHSPFWRSTRSI